MAKRNRGEGTIYYSEARKQWIGQFTKTIEGEKIRKSVYGATKNEVSEKLLDLRIEMKDADFIKEKGMPLIQIMELIRDKKYNSNKIKDGQYSRITKTIEKIHDSKIGKMNVKDITADNIQDFLNDNKEYSNSTIKKLYEQFNQAFEYAIRNKYIKDNPMHDVIKPKSIKQDKEVRALTIDEQKELSDYLFKSSIKDEKYKNVFLIQMYMGLRIGETLALTKNDIDLPQKLLFVNRTTTIGKNGETIIGDSTKTYAGKRSIPIPDFMISIFKEQIEISKNNKDNFLFLNDDKLITNSACNSRLKRILLDKLGWENTGISTHSLRHTFATRCIESGVNAVVLQRLLGHTDISITLNTYTSVFNLFKDNELEKVIELYKNNSLVTKKEDYIKISPKEILESTEKSTSTLIQAESIEKFQNGTEDIYIDEEYDEMEF